MSINSYATLQAAIGNWLDRSDLTSRIPEFITLAEARIGRRLRVRGIESTDTTALTGATSYALPTDFLEARRFYIDCNPYQILSYRSPQQLETEFPSGYTYGSLGGYTIIGANIYIRSDYNATGNTLYTDYFAKLSALSDSSDTNWLTTNAPDLLLYGSLIEAEAYLVGDPRIPIWKAAFDEAIEEWNMLEMKARHSGSILEIRQERSNP